MSINYIMIGSNDLERSRRFYDPVMAELGGTIVADYPGFAFCYGFDAGARVWISRPYDKQQAAPGNGMMPGYAGRNEDAVRAAHAAALANGGTNEGDPGPRPQYGPHFFGGYVRDPDGNKMSFVYLGGAA